MTKTGSVNRTTAAIGRLSFTMSLLFTISFYGPSTFANSPSKSLEEQIESWLFTQGLQDEDFTVQANDARLQVPFCDTSFQINSGNLTNGSIVRTVRATCPEPRWSRLIRLKNKIHPSKKVRQGNDIKTTEVLVTEGAINQYSRITREQLVERKINNNRLPRNVLDESYFFKNSYAARPLRAGHVITTSDLIKPKKVVVVNSPLSAHSLLNKQNLSLKYRLKGLPIDAVESLEGLENLATNKLIHSGDILRKRDLTKAKLIKRGELVLVEAKSNDFHIISEAIAFQDGYLGDQIKLTSVDSKRQLQATVVERGKVNALSKKWIIKY